MNRLLQRLEPLFDSVTSAAEKALRERETGAWSVNVGPYRASIAFSVEGAAGAQAVVPAQWEGPIIEHISVACASSPVYEFKIRIEYPTVIGFPVRLGVVEERVSQTHHSLSVDWGKPEDVEQAQSLLKGFRAGASYQFSKSVARFFKDLIEAGFGPEELREIADEALVQNVLEA